MRQALQFGMNGFATEMGRRFIGDLECELHETSRPNHRKFLAKPRLRNAPALPQSAIVIVGPATLPASLALIKISVARS